MSYLLYNTMYFLFNCSWVLRSMELYHGMTADPTSENDEGIESLPPSKILNLLFEVMYICI